MSSDDTRESWSRKLAELAVDSLVTRRLVRKDDFDLAVEIVTEEILVRLALSDFPPRRAFEAKPNDA